MNEIAKEIVAKLSLDSKEFNANVGKTGKEIVGLTATVAGMGAAFFAATKMVANYQDEIIKASRATGTSAEEFSALTHAAELSGLEMEQLSANLKKLSKPSAEAQSLLYGFGVTLNDNKGHLKSQTQLLGEVGDKLNQLKNPQDRVNAAMTIFGEDSGPKMLTMLSKGAAGLKEMAEEAQKMGLIVSKEAGENAEKFNEDIKKTTESIFGLTNVIGTSIIAFMNQNSIMKTIREAIQGVTLWWSNLSQETKDTIIQIGIIATTIAGVALALAGIIAVAPYVKSAFTTMFGPIGIAIMAITVIVFELIKYFDQIKKSLLPVGEVISEVFSNIGDMFNSIIEPISTFFKSINKSAETTSDNISVMGTIVNVVMKGIATAIIVVVGVFNLLVDTVKGVIGTIEHLAKAAIFDKLGIAKGMEDEMGKALDVVKDTGKEMANDVSKSIDKIKDTFKSGIFVHIQDEHKKTIDKIKENNAGMLPALLQTKDLTLDAFSQAIIQLRNMGDNANQYIDAQISALNRKLVMEAKTLTNSEITEIKFKIDVLNSEKSLTKIMAFANMIDQIGQKSKVIIDAVGGITDAIAAKIGHEQELAQRDFEVQLALLKKSQEAEKKALEDSEQAKLDALDKFYQDQIDALKNAEDQKTAITEQAVNARLLALNDEYQKAVELENQKYADIIAAETARYEAQKAIYDQEVLDKEQRELTDSFMDEDFKNYLEALEAEHQQRLADLGKTFSDQQKAVDDKNKADKVSATALNKAAIEALQKQQDDARLKAEQEKNDKLNALAAKQKAEEDALNKAKVQSQWDAEVAQYESTKAIKIAEVVATTASAAAQGFAAAMAYTAPIIPLGLALGGSIASLIIASGVLQIANINASAPIKPAALMLEQGGVIGGNTTHAMGGIAANVQSGEAVVDKARTSQILDFIDSGMQNSGGIHVVFAAGSIVTGDSLVDDNTIELFAQKFGQRIERFGAR